VLCSKSTAQRIVSAQRKTERPHPMMNPICTIHSAKKKTNVHASNPQKQNKKSRSVGGIKTSRLQVLRAHACAYLSPRRPLAKKAKTKRQYREYGTNDPNGVVYDVVKEKRNFRCDPLLKLCCPPQWQLAPKLNRRHRAQERQVPLARRQALWTYHRAVDVSVLLFRLDAVLALWHFELECADRFL